MQRIYICCELTKSKQRIDIAICNAKCKNKCEAYDDAVAIKVPLDFSQEDNP